MNDLHRVFWHELGHFVAQELNYRFYKGPGTKEIIIYRSPNNYDFFEGKTIVNREDDKEYIPPIECFTFYLASSVYGCIFQAYFRNETLDDCFVEHGKGDSEQWGKIICRYGFNGYQPDLFACEKKYFNKLKENGGLDELKDINPDDYLVNDGNDNYHINIDELKKVIDKFISSHVKVYETLVQSYNNLLEL